MFFLRNSLLTLSCLVLICILPDDSIGQTTDNNAGGTSVELASGEYRLQARFFATDATGSPPTILMLGDLPGADVNKATALGLARNLSDRGMNVLTFNYRGTHGSNGVFTLSGVDQDIDAARRWLRSENTTGRFDIDPDTIVMGGYGFGGGMALAYSSTDLAITDVFSIAGFDQSVGMGRYSRDPMHQEVLKNRLTRSSENGESLVRWERGDFFAYVKEALQGSGRWDLLLAAPQLARKRMLLVGGADDTEVGLEEHILPLYRILRGLGTQDLKLIVYQDDHEFGEVSDQLTDALGTWIERVTDN
jgi:fermentation-respiration switch protein FrsA (DUF1100 family)